MEVTLTPEQSDVVRHAVETGRVRDSVQAVQQAMTLWVERERQHAELLSSIDEAEASLARGEAAITRESMLALAKDVKRLGREQVGARSLSGRSELKEFP